MCEPKDCSSCKHLMPCKAETKSQDMTLCEKFEDFFPEDDGLPTLEELQAINASIPEDDPIEPDYTRCEDVKLTVNVGGVQMEVKQ